MKPHLVTNRPSWATEAVLIASAKELAMEMPASAGDKDAMIPALIDALQSNGPFFDAYHMARHLENTSRWTCNMDIVEACEAAHAIVHQHLREAEALWVRENGITAKLQIGAAVPVRTIGPDGKPLDFTGEIAKIDATYARYLVRIAALGHVQEGEGCHGQSYPFEKFDSLVTNTN